MATVSATDANREFSNLLRRVGNGETITITARGRPVAVMSPAVAEDTAAETAARQALLQRLRSQPIIPVTWTRDELYDD